MSITFSTCWYAYKAKFPSSVFSTWIKNFLSIVNNFNLVIYTDEKSKGIFVNLVEKNNKIKIIIKPEEEFYNYKYKDYFIKNHKNNDRLNTLVDWKVNMLWCEKISFVKETIEKKYFDTEFYGWCDIGYFRNREKDMNTDALVRWCPKEKINSLVHDKVYYALINNDANYVQQLYGLVNDKNIKGLPKIPIPPHQLSIAGGFFILHKNLIDEWFNLFDKKLKLYFENNYLVKDDQIIIADCIFSNVNKFNLVSENSDRYENWFLFQRYLN